MVNVTKGVLVECDPAMKQLLLHLNEKLVLGSSFVIQVNKLFQMGPMSLQFTQICFQDLDETHLFISQEVLELLQDKIDELMDKISIPIVEGKSGDK